MQSGSAPVLVLPTQMRLHYKQTLAYETIATEVLYGGAAGGGKSHLMRVAAISWCVAIPGLQVYLFRRSYKDLVKNHMEGPSGFRALLAGAIGARIVDDEVRFANGSKIFLCHCQHEQDRFNYQGAEIHVLLIDELTHFTEVIYRFLRGRVRMVGLTVPPALEGLFPRIICGANPGGVGHLFVKGAFIDNVVPMELVKHLPSEGGMIRQYIPARLDDNPSMAKDDPSYSDRLSGLGSEALVKAMRDGDWDVIDGAFFDCWSSAKHVVRPFEIPAHWLRFRAGDWGSAKPFSFGWYAVVSDDYTTREGQLLPRGCMIRYREWYGAKKDAQGKIVPNVGLKLTAKVVGRGVRSRDYEDRIAYGVLDPAAFAEDGGPSQAEEMMAGGATFRRADNKRTARMGAMGGWDQLRARLVGDDDGNPMLVFFNVCANAIRTIPALQHDENNPEDLDSDMEDHVGDEVRYACMSRPWIKDTQHNRTAQPPPGHIRIPPPQKPSSTRIRL
jgi:hypothetical protein